jgi:Ni/Fe-hydrogenase subunit HybB-like protein
MAIIRRSCHLEGYLKPIHFNNLGLLLLVMSLLWFYFTFTENLTSFYGGEPSHLAVVFAKLTGPYAPYFWTMIFFCFVLPVIILSIRKTRTIKGTTIVSLGVLVGMWLERYTIVLPTLVNPRLPYERGLYSPTWVEFAITAGCFATFILLYMLFTKIFPIVSIWEIKEGEKIGIEETVARIKSYLPDSDS